MFILNKKTGNIQECHNADAIKVCRKDTDHYAVAATKEELEGKAANKPQNGPEKPEAGENTNTPEKAAPEGAEKLTEGNGEQQAAGGNAEGGEKQQEGSGKPEEGAGEEKTGNDPLNGAGDERLAELNGKKVAELREIAKGMGIQGYANMNKDTLVAMIMNH
ncbi:hypothetical protein IMSAG025_01110 [Muribaculaceae bacterium]|nr:hypothetical protein IMSAG025_01110 [Muribaculaceae bacterium]